MAKLPGIVFYELRPQRCRKVKLGTYYKRKYNEAMKAAAQFAERERIIKENADIINKKLK